MKTLRLDSSPPQLAKAAQMVRNGEIVAFPTETVYGLGADARNSDAVAQIFEAKGRPSFNPLIAHVASLDQVGEIAVFSDAARSVAEHFWPGPLTIVLPLKPDAGISPLATAGLTTIGLRVPRHEAALAFLREVGGPVVAPSANLSGQVSPVLADHVLSGLDGKIAAVIDDGATIVGLESTILTFDPGPVLLRAGGISVEDLEAMLDEPLAQPSVPRVRSPGQLASHYAPEATLRLNARAPREGEFWVGFGPDPSCVSGLSLSPSGDLREAASRLYPVLHELNALNVRAAAVAPIPMEGLGRAINDRLTRAAAPR